jgi:tetratricopeptide repeat protein 8
MRKALELAQTDELVADVWFNVGHIAVQTGDIGLAYQAFRVAVAHDPNHAEAATNLAVLDLRKGNTDAARAGFRNANRIAPYLYEPAYNAALLAYKLGDLEDAFAMVQKAIEAYPGHHDSAQLKKRLERHFMLA